VVCGRGFWLAEVGRSTGPWQTDRGIGTLTRVGGSWGRRTRAQRGVRLGLWHTASGKLRRARIARPRLGPSTTRSGHAGSSV
jgi:hypothetical protein